ncbi:MAG: hypothetical protein GF417_07605, partial [Candidatus Latescibacteria bacterium]|nr:hypothetical protein [bacterium]MBD3424285.1 hypothetical protein [Candidatus Latescibacterota bacterium]
MKSSRIAVAISSIILFSVLIPGQLFAEWVKVAPDSLTDVDKDPPGDMSCWLATASNMLAGAGYGDGITFQERAEDIYDELMD